MHIYRQLVEQVGLVRESLRREDGQGMVEYSLIVGFISLGVVAAFTATDIAGEVGNIAAAIVTALQGV